jgi:hypothetical protein
MFALRFLVIKFDPGGCLVSRSLSKCVTGHHFQSLSIVGSSDFLLENMYQYLNLLLLSLRALQPHGELWACLLLLAIDSDPLT